MKKAKHTLLVRGIQGALAAALVLSQSAMAGSVTVRVVDASTLMPVKNVAVCLGSQNEPQAYGAQRTNDAGEVVYDRAPTRDFVLSVSGEGQGDYVRETATRRFDIVHYVALQKNQRGSRCFAPTAKGVATPGKPALNLVSVDVTSHKHSSGVVSLDTRVEGVVPTHMRVSTRKDFGGATWKPYRARSTHRVSAVSSENLYVQVKRTLRSGESSVEAVSTAQVGDLHWN